MTTSASASPIQLSPPWSLQASNSARSLSSCNSERLERVRRREPREGAEVVQVEHQPGA
jgi:hypothetical protein